MKEGFSKQKQNLSGLIVLVLFGVFAVCILAVLLSGTSVYDRLVERDEKAFDDRTAGQYLATRIHSAVNADAISLTEVEGSTAIRMTEYYGDEEYMTLLYCRDGWLYELFAESDIDIEPEAGEKILPAEKIDGEIENGLLTLHLKDSSGEQTVRIALRRGEGRP